MKHVIHGAKLLSRKLEAPTVSSFITITISENGYFEGVASSDEELPSTSNVTITDLEGKTISPAFFDGHVHVLLTGSSILKVNVEKCRSLAEIQDTIRREAHVRTDARVLCHGWMQYSTDGIALASNLDDLDPQDRPIYITAKDLHSAWCNSAALKELDVQSAPDPEGGTIHRDAAGNPSGLMSEAACISYVWPFLDSKTTIEQNLSYVREAIRAYTAAGYTGITELATDRSIWDLLTHLRANEPQNFNVRVACYWLIAPCKTVEDAIDQVNTVIELHKKFNLRTSPDLRIAGIKLILDGVIDACTAAISERYNHTTIKGDMLWQPDHIAAVVSHADKAGLQCALHAIGDRAVTIAIDTIEANGTPGNRHRIEHLELTRPEDAARLGKIGITASIQPVHSDPAILRAWDKLLGKDRCARAFAYSEFEQGGARLAIGTDSPTAPHEPFPNLHVATTRRSARRDAGDEEALEPINTISPLSRLSAMQAATEGAAYSVFADGIAGSIAVGKSADFVVVEQSEAGEGLMGYKVKETWFRGRRVWKDDQ